MALTPDSDGQPEQSTDFREAWSDAARAAAAAARKGRGKGLIARRTAAHDAFFGPGLQIPDSRLKNAHSLGWDDATIGARNRARVFKKPSQKVAYNMGFTKTKGTRSLAVNARGRVRRTKGLGSMLGGRNRRGG